MLSAGRGVDRIFPRGAKPISLPSPHLLSPVSGGPGVLPLTILKFNIAVGEF